MKSLGGNRLKIEETDGSSEDDEIEDEDEEEYQENLKVNSRVSSSEKEGQTRQIKIAEVESDESEGESEMAVETNNVVPAVTKVEVESKLKTMVTFKLDQKLIEEKDKGNQKYKNGQYGEAVEHYAKVIDELNKILKSYKSN